MRDEVAPPPPAPAPRAGFTDLFIHRPVLATVVSLLILLLGVQAFTALPIRQFPELTNTTITVTTTYPGATAELMQGFVTVPIQQAVASTDGIEVLTSSSTQSASTVTMVLRLNADGDKALTEVLSKINQVRNVLPREANDPVVVKNTGEIIALMYVGFASSTLSLPQITDYLTRVVQPRLQAIEGVGEARVIGGQTFAMRIWLNPERMAALGVTPADVQAALRANNFVSAPGQIKGDLVQIDINAQTSPASAEDFSRLVVAARANALIRLGDVADVELGPRSVASSSFLGDQKAVYVGIYSVPTANPLTVIADVRRDLPRLEAELPPGLSARVAYDATLFINASIEEVIRTIGETALIVIVVLFLFLGNVRATIIPIVTIPLSLVGTLFILLALGYSINLLTLLAMVLAIGLVVDDAIVVVENVFRHIEDGERPLAAALHGARDIAMPVIAMTITLAAVYAPIGFTTGLTGALFREFAFALAGAVVISGIVALTLSPMMCARLLKEGGNQGSFSRMVDRVFGALRRSYERRLSATLARPSRVVVLAALVLIACPLLYLGAPKELAPPEDRGVLFMAAKSPQYANLDYHETFTREIGELMKTYPEYLTSFHINGLPTPNQS
ncbi:MAG: multidrug efflux protein, partial [Alphaproteobacteria bacterium]|nr:multidrug efflux protein [Alphaproteobacteria bacterium]